MPDTFHVEASEAVFDDPILLRSVRGDEFLGQAIVGSDGPEAAILKEKSIVTAHDWDRALGSQRPNAASQGYPLGPPLSRIRDCAGVASL